MMPPDLPFWQISVLTSTKCAPSRLGDWLLTLRVCLVVDQKNREVHESVADKC